MGTGGDGRQMTGKKKTQREDEWVGGREKGRREREGEERWGRTLREVELPKKESREILRCIQSHVAKTNT